MAEPTKTASKHATETLVLAAQKGDHAAFSRLIADMLPLVRRQSAKYKSILLDSDDLLQEGLLGLMTAVRTYRPGGEASFPTYARVCVNNRIRSALRKVSGAKRVPENELVPWEDNLGAAPSLSLEEMQDLREECKQILDAIETGLSATEKSVLKLFLSGLSYCEIAEKIGSSPKSVDNALQRVRHKLKK